MKICSIAIVCVGSLTEQTQHCQQALVVWLVGGVEKMHYVAKKTPRAPDTIVTTSLLYVQCEHCLGMRTQDDAACVNTFIGGK